MADRAAVTAAAPAAARPRRWTLMERCLLLDAYCQHGADAGKLSAATGRSPEECNEFIARRGGMKRNDLDAAQPALPVEELKCGLCAARLVPAEARQCYREFDFPPDLDDATREMLQICLPKMLGVNPQLMQSDTVLRSLLARAQAEREAAVLPGTRRCRSMYCAKCSAQLDPAQSMSGMSAPAANRMFCCTRCWPREVAPVPAPTAPAKPHAGLAKAAAGPHRPPAAVEGSAGAVAAAGTTAQPGADNTTADGTAMKKPRLLHVAVGHGQPPTEARAPPVLPPPAVSTGRSSTATSAHARGSAAASAGASAVAAGLGTPMSQDDDTDLEELATILSGIGRQ